MRRALMAVLLMTAPLFAGEVPQQALSAAQAQELEQYRAGRIERMGARNGWLSVVGLHWLMEGDNFFGPGADNAILLDVNDTPDVAGNFKYEEGRVFLLPIKDAGVTMNGNPASGTQLSDGANTPTIGLGRYQMRVINRSGRHAIRVRDPQAPAIDAFKGIEFYPGNAAYTVVGKLVPYEAPRSYFVETVVGTQAELVSRGIVEFTLGGETHRLEASATSEEATDLFLMFKDGTTGKGTYPAGRYLLAPFDGTQVMLDFNKAYNPPCAFTAYATCPLPPADNKLNIAIEAGERTHHPD